MIQLQKLNDDTVYDQKSSAVQKALRSGEAILEQIESEKEAYIQATDERSYEIAHECIKAIIQNATLQTSSGNYGKLRDQYMKDRVAWLYEFENNQMVFITGQDGHIDKSSTVKSYTSMGKLLADEYGDDYYAIGTDCISGEVNIVDTMGNRKNISVTNKNKVNTLFEQEDGNIFYLDFEKAAGNATLQDCISKRQKMMNIGSTLGGYYKFSKLFYTLNMTPEEAYDSLIIVKQVTPTEPWQLEN